MLTGAGWVQVAWHYSATDETRTFAVSYVMEKYVSAYRDVGDLYLQAWGDQWPVGLRRLHVDVLLPGAADRRLVKVWGHPASVHGTVRVVSPSHVVLDAANIPAHRYVELETTFPRRLLTSTAGTQVQAANGLASIVARERRAYASGYGSAPDPVGSAGTGGGGSFFSRYWFFGAFALFAGFGVLGRVRRNPGYPWYSTTGWYRDRRSSSSGAGSSGGGGDFGGGGGDSGGGGGGGGGGGAW